MKKILVPTDFSPASMNAYKFALDYAQRTGSEIVVINPIDIPVIQESAFGIQPFLYSQEMYRDAVESSYRIFERMKERFPSPVRVSFQPLHDELITGLPEFVRNFHIDLVIVSAAGHHGIEEFLFGSQSRKIARHSPVPVLILPNAASLPQIKDIVFPNSLEEDQDGLIRDIVDFQKSLQARLHLLFINTSGNHHSEEESLALLHSFATYYQLTNYTANFRYSDSEESGIIQFTREIGADLVAMGTHGRTGLSQLLNGSIAESVLTKIDRPVLVCKLL